MTVRVLMRFPPEWEFVDRVREFTGFFCEKAFAASVADRVRVVIQEALEDAMRHPSTAIRREVQLSIASEGQDLEIEITSAPDRKQVARLKSNLATVNSQAPEAAFIEALAGAALDPTSSERVGLARMRYEAEMDLAAEEGQDGSLRFSAKGHL